MSAANVKQELYLTTSSALWDGQLKAAWLFLLFSLLSEALIAAQYKSPILSDGYCSWNGRAPRTTQLFIDHWCCTKLCTSPANQLYSRVRQHAHSNCIISLPCDGGLSSWVNPIIETLLLLVHKLWSNREICLKTRHKMCICVLYSFHMNTKEKRGLVLPTIFKLEPNSLCAPMGISSLPVHLHFPKCPPYKQADKRYLSFQTLRQQQYTATQNWATLLHHQIRVRSHNFCFREISALWLFFLTKQSAESSGRRAAAENQRAEWLHGVPG